MKLISEPRISGADEESSSPEDRICRYCHDDDSALPLISPCDCKGSAAFIHKDCALQWILLSETKTCELCNSHFRCRPSRWSQFKSALRSTRFEAFCYIVVFVIFMAPVIIFKTIADSLRYNGVLTYRQADRLLTGGLFGTYFVIIIFGVVFVAAWMHRCAESEQEEERIVRGEEIEMEQLEMEQLETALPRLTPMPHML